MKKFVFAIILLIASHSFAQISVIGVVKDSIGNPLEMANILAINSKTSNVDSYGFTDAQGNYRLNLKENSVYNVKFSYVGMKTLEANITTQKTDIKKDITLFDDTQLAEVNIVYTMPVSVKGDTIVYNADSFNKGTEKKLEDVLENLPGVEVNENGEVKVEGKKVNKVMVEGKDFFDGDSKLATKNIPANAVDKVEVLKDYNEVGQLKSVTDNEDNVVLNIKLKEGKKKFWFGDVSAGSAIAIDEGRYIVNPKLFYYSPKFSVNLIGNLNNIGEVPFTLSDYFKFTGGFGAAGSDGTSMSLSSSDFSFLALRNNQAKDIRSRFGAVNFNYNPHKTWALGGFVIYSNSDVETEETSIRNYINLNNNDDNAVAVEQTNTKQQQESNFTLTKFSSSYVPNKNNQFDYDMFAKFSNQKLNRDVLSNQVAQNGTETLVPIYDFNKQSPFSVKQSANYYYTLNDNNIFALESQYLIQNENPFYNARLAQLAFADELGLDNQSIYDVSQNKKVKTNRLDANLDYYHVLNPKSILNVTIGSTLSKQQFNSDIFQILDDGSRVNILDATTLNDVKFSLNDNYLGLHYKFITGIFTFNQGVTLHQYNTYNDQLNEKTKLNFTRLLPDAFIKMALKKSESLRLNYNMQVEFTDVNNVAEGYVFNNYSSLFKGNQFLENSLSHNLRLSYNSFSSFNYTSLFASVNYNKKIDAIKSISQLSGISQISSSINSVFPDETISANINFQKRFRKFKVDLDGSVSHSKLNNLYTDFQTQTNQNRESKSFTQSYRTKLSTNFRNAPNFDVGYNLSINKYNQTDFTNTYTTHSPFLNLEYYFLKSFLFQTKCTYNNYRSDNQSINNYSFWNANLNYKENESPWELELSITNLLNTKTLNNDTSTSLYNSSMRYKIQPRYAVLSIKYNL